MALPIVDEQSIEALDLPGRMLRWVVTKENINAQNCSMCVIEVQPGQTVKPAHSHPHGEEIIYLLSGSGRVWIEGEIGDVKQGCAVPLPAGKDSHVAKHQQGSDEGSLLLRSVDKSG